MTALLIIEVDTLNFGARIDLKPNTRTPASLLGDHSVSDPPDPIPNSAVKPDCADGTIAQALEE